MIPRTLKNPAALLFLPIIPLLLSSRLDAQTWNGTASSDWATGTNWSGSTVPTGNTLVNTTTGNIATVSSAISQQPTLLRVGDGAGGAMNLETGGSLSVNGEMWLGNGNGGTGGFNMSGGSLTVGNWLVMGRLGATNANGTMNITDGTLTKNGAGNLNIGEGSIQSSLNVSNASVIVNTGELWVGQGGKGAVNLDPGGSIVANNWVVVARALGEGVFNMTGGTFTKQGANHFVIGNGNGAVNQSGGTFTTSGADLRISEGGVGLYNLTGGTSSVGAVAVGNNSTSSGELRISGTGQMTAGAVTLGVGNSVSGTVNLNGGSLQANSIGAGASSGTKAFNFNGGQFVANNSQTINTAANFTTTINSGGATIDTAGNTVTWNPALMGGTGNGGLTKIGAGTLVLAKSNTYTGHTVINDGTLVVTSPSFADTASVTVGAVAGSSAVLNLNFSGNDVVDSLLIDGVTVPPGVYDATTHPTDLSGTGSLEVIAPYVTWAAFQGLDGSLGRENGFGADPDADGIGNGLEWVLGGAPLTGDLSGILPLATYDSTHLTMTFHREDTSEGSIDLKAQWGEDLVTWNNVAIGSSTTAPDLNGVSVTVQENGSAPDLVTVKVPRANSTTGRLFVRANAVTNGNFASPPAYTGPPITLQSLLAEMTSFDSVAKWPYPEYLCLQSSSHDRQTVAPDQPGWFANNDFTQYLRTEINSGRHENVMMDMQGPGCIVRFWLTTTQNKSGVLRVYLDNSTAPAITFPAFDLLSGSLNPGEPLLQAHPGYSPTGVGGNTLMLPIPYAKACKVTWEEQGSGPRYYQINYRKYPTGTKVETYTPAVLQAAGTAISQADQILLAPPAPAATSPLFLNTTLAAGTESGLDLPAGPAAVREMELQVTPPPGGSVESALRATIVRMEFDGEETIWCPASDFFGSGVGINELRNWYRTVNTDGTMTCRWVMPYQSTARVTLENVGNQNVTCHLRCSTGAWEWDNLSMHFHSTWHYEGDLRTPPASDWNFVDLGGRGVYVGDTLSLYNQVATWYGEGDEKIRVDGEVLPSHIGTGTEDYYNYSFAPRGIMQTPFASQTRVDQAMTQGHNVMTRSRNLDGIPFKSSLTFDFELISWAATREIYAATTHWYAFPGATSNGVPEPENAAAYIPTLADAQQPPAAFLGALDAEQLAITSKTGGLVTETQDMEGYGVGMWSSGKQLLGRADSVGAFVVLRIPAADNSPRSLILSATRAADFGILSFTVNGQPAAFGFDGYAPTVTHAAEVVLGTFQPVAGYFDVRVEVTGTYPATNGSKYYFGLDYFKLETP